MLLTYVSILALRRGNLKVDLSDGERYLEGIGDG